MLVTLIDKVEDYLDTQRIFPFNVLIKGFETKKQAETFISWYSGQGEQCSDIWFEEAVHQEEIHSPKNPMFKSRNKDLDTDDTIVMTVRF